MTTMITESREGERAVFDLPPKVVDIGRKADWWPNYQILNSITSKADCVSIFTNIKLIISKKIISTGTLEQLLSLWKPKEQYLTCHQKLLTSDEKLTGDESEVQTATKVSNPEFHNIKRKLGFNTFHLKAILWCAIYYKIRIISVPIQFLWFFTTWSYVLTYINSDLEYG